MSKRVYILVNGILNFPGSAKNWNGRGVTWLHLHDGDGRAEKVEYFCGPIGRAFGQQQRAEKLAATIRYYHGWDIVLVGHSNGTDVILKALALLSWPRISALHLVSAACDACFETNGLNLALLSGTLDRCFVYVAERDMALRAAHTLIGKWLGYGTLGLHGPLNISPQIVDRVGVLHFENFGHSDCFADHHFDRTMHHFLDLNSTA